MRIMRAQAKLSIGRDSKHRIAIEVRDAVRHQTVLELYVDAETFAYVITGAGRQDCEMHFNLEYDPMGGPTA